MRKLGLLLVLLLTACGVVVPPIIPPPIPVPENCPVADNFSPLWGDCQVPFTIDSSVTPEQRQGVHNAVNNWNALTRVQWVARSSQVSYVKFAPMDPGEGILGRSAVGRIGGEQTLEFSNTALTTLHHEMGHAVNLRHEFQRCDRDKYIDVSRSSLPKAELTPICDVWSLLRPPSEYDWNSVMNYPPGFGITSKPPYYKTVGHLEQSGRVLTSGDVALISWLYGGTL